MNKKKLLFNVIRVLVLALLVWLIIGKIEVRELRSVFSRIDMTLLFLAIPAFFIVPLLTIWRWKILLRIQGVPMGFWALFKLTYIGMFFNNAMPGMTGGDLIKAYYVAKQTHKKTEAITTVFLDRLVGMAGLITICSVMLIFKLNDPKFRDLGVYILAAIGAGLIGAIIFFTDRLRRLLGINKLLSVLPFQKVVREIDSAILLYKQHVRTVLLLILMSVAVHIGMALVNFILGRAIGISMGFTDYLVLVPILLTIMALPISIAGWGVGEMAYIQILNDVAGVAASNALALSLLQRMIQMVLSLLGGVFLLTGGKRIKAGEMIHEMEEAEEELGQSGE